ncbi:MAG: hypothetical protein LBB60_10455 [Desulfovibrio sp.]|jgi:hypothetical protein|nr:hypothetical protein [Desulfovibrio sp.]
MVTYTDIAAVGPISSAEQILSILGQKIGSGQQLTMPETLMAMSMVAKQRMDAYGPSPTNMKLKTPALPEDVKGVLANYSSV